MEDSFSRFGLNRHFEVDLVDLEDRYLRACKAAHPDHLHDTGLSFVTAAELSLALVNHDYETIRNPVSRAELLLVLSGGATAQEQRVVSTDFLETMIELREAMTEARTPSDWILLETKVKSKQECSKGKLPELCSIPMTSENKDSLRKLLNEIAFLESIERDLREQTA